MPERTPSGSDAAAEVAIPPNRIFLPICILLLGGWFFLLSEAPKIIPLYTVVGVCIVWAAYRLPLAGSAETLAGFFLYERKMPRKEFVGTLVTTNIGFFSSVAFSTLLIASLGVGPAIIAAVAWIAGLYAFSTQIPKLIPFLRKGSTLHEYIGISFGRNDREIRRLALYSSIITFLLYIASVGVEIKYSADVFAAVAGVSPWLLAGTLCISGIFYVAIAGYRGVVSTDRMRLWAVLAGVAAIYLFIYVYWPREPTSWPADFMTLQSWTIGGSMSTLISIVILLALYQFCVMDMWERCIAIANSPLGQSSLPSEDRDAHVAAVIRKLLVRDSILPFIFLFSAWYGIGALSVAQSWTADPTQIIPVFFQKIELLAVTDPILARSIGTVVIICFLSAALSTIDGFLIAAVQTIVFDWLGYRSKVGVEGVGRVTEARALLISRALIIVCGGLAVLFAFAEFDLLSFWVGMYSLMLAFFPPIWSSLHRREGSPRPTPGTVAAAILLGAASALGLSIIGTFVMPATILAALAAPAAVIISAAILIGGPKTRAV
jgi:Na+/proline symporter